MKVVELTVEKTAFGGEGIAHLPGGKTCFVEGALPGETVSAEILSEKKNFVKARIKRVLQASSHRVTPPCPYYDHCGGCQYQHVSYPIELKFKEDQVRELLSHQAGIDPSLISPIRFTDRDYGYRNSVTLHAQYPSNKGRALPVLQAGAKKNALTGFIAKDNCSLVPVKNCLLADEQLEPVFRLKLRDKKKSDRVTFKLSENGQIVSDLEETFFRIRLKEESFLVSSQGFFQNNLAVTELIAVQILRWVEEEAPEEFFDLYAGVGIFSFLSAKSVPKIVCVEENAQSIQALKMNRDERKRTQMEIMEGKAERLFPDRFRRNSKAKTMVLMDPPRQGIDAELARFLARDLDASSLVYLSCDPSTLARDLKILLSGGRYKVTDVVPFDMFPRTAHVEVLVRLMNCQRGSIDGIIG